MKFYPPSCNSTRAHQYTLVHLWLWQKVLNKAKLEMQIPKSDFHLSIFGIHSSFTKGALFIYSRDRFFFFWLPLPISLMGFGEARKKLAANCRALYMKTEVHELPRATLLSRQLTNFFFDVVIAHFKQVFKSHHEVFFFQGLLFSGFFFASPGLFEIKLKTIANKSKSSGQKLI